MKLERLQQDKEIILQLVDFAYFKENYRLIAADLSNQKELDVDSRAIQQMFLLIK